MRVLLNGMMLIVEYLISKDPVVVGESSPVRHDATPTTTPQEGVDVNDIPYEDKVRMLDEAIMQGVNVGNPITESEKKQARYETERVKNTSSIPNITSTEDIPSFNEDVNPRIHNSGDTLTLKELGGQFVDAGKELVNAAVDDAKIAKDVYMGMGKGLENFGVNVDTTIARLAGAISKQEAEHIRKKAAEDLGGKNKAETVGSVIGKIFPYFGAGGILGASKLPGIAGFLENLGTNLLSGTGLLALEQGEQAKSEEMRTSLVMDSLAAGLGQFFSHALPKIKDTGTKEKIVYLNEEIQNLGKGDKADIVNRIDRINKGIEQLLIDDNVPQKIKEEIVNFNPNNLPVVSTAIRLPEDVTAVNSEINAIKSNILPTDQTPRLPAGTGEPPSVISLQEAGEPSVNSYFQQPDPNKINTT